MKKLISKNPIQRFKQGKQIVKFEDGGYTSNPNQEVTIGPLNIHTSRFKYFKSGLIPGIIRGLNDVFGPGESKKQQKWLDRIDPIISPFTPNLARGIYLGKAIYGGTKDAINKFFPNSSNIIEEGQQVLENISQNSPTISKQKTSPRTIIDGRGIWLNGYNHGEVRNIKETQEWLNANGFNAGSVDGKWGDKTERAYQAYINSGGGLSKTEPIKPLDPSKLAGNLQQLVDKIYLKSSIGNDNDDTMHIYNRKHKQGGIIKAQFGWANRFKNDYNKYKNQASNLTENF